MPCGIARRDEKILIQGAVDRASLTKEAFLRVVEIIERYHGIQYSVGKGQGRILIRPRGIFISSRIQRFGRRLFTLADYVIERRL